MRSEFFRALGLVWLAALAMVVFAALLTAAAALLPSLAIPAPMTGAAMLAACVVALLATPFALAPAVALKASLAAPEGTPVWGSERNDIWGDLAREVLGRSPPTAGSARSEAEQAARRDAEAMQALLRDATQQLAAMRAESGQASQAMQAAGQGAARLDGLAQQVEARLVQALRYVEHVAGQLAQLRPAELDQVAQRAGIAVAAVEQAAGLLHAMRAGTSQPDPATPERVERALSGLTEAISRLAARPAPAAASPIDSEALAAAQQRAEQLASTLLPLSERFAALPGALYDEFSARLDDALLPLSKQAEATAATLAIEAGRLDPLCLRLEESAKSLRAVEALSPILAELTASVAAVRDHASALADAPERLEAKVAAGQARLQDAAAMMAAAAADAVAATQRTTRQAAYDLMTTAEAARLSLASVGALADGVDAARRALDGAAERLGGVGAAREVEASRQPRPIPLLEGEETLKTHPAAADDESDAPAASPLDQGEEQGEGEKDPAPDEVTPRPRPAEAA